MRQFVCLCVFALLLVGHMPAAAGNPEAKTHSVTIPLEDGRLHVGRMFAEALRELGIDPASIGGELDWSIEVESMFGRGQLAAIRELTGEALRVSIVNDKAVVTFDPARIEQHMKQFGVLLDEKVGEALRALEGDGASPRMGLSLIEADGSVRPFDQVLSAPQEIVLLVHGLDEPGGIWDDLIPRLIENDLAVARFDYANDGPISESADDLARALAVMRKLGVKRVDVVAHSMGGLVTRDVLTRRAYYDGDAAGSDRLPAMRRFIMVGTPNHGSQLARLRGLGELREYLLRAASGDRSMTGLLRDGAGEAGVDLLPGSDFLRRLNDRPLARNVEHTIIIGRASPFEAEDLRELSQQLRDHAKGHNAPEWLRQWINDADEERIVSGLNSAIDGLGDGLVTVQSARLDGVDDTEVVSGNHITLLRTFGSGDPPALAIIIDRLKRTDS